LTLRATVRMLFPNLELHICQILLPRSNGIHRRLPTSNGVGTFSLEIGRDSESDSERPVLVRFMFRDQSELRRRRGEDTESRTETEPSKESGE
jgi:hypothetical protein